MINKWFPRSQAANAAPAESGSIDEDAIKVLVVDDVPDILDYFRGVFRRVRGVSYDLEVEVDSATALTKVGETPFDVVITDFRMKGVNGVEILQKAKEMNPDGLRVLMTGYNEIPASMTDILAADVDAYVQKPLAAQDLLLLLLDLLNRNDAAIARLRTQAREIEQVAENEEQHHGSERAAASF